MALTHVYRPAGPTVALSVGIAAHGAVALTRTVNEVVTWAALLNTGAVAVAVKLSVIGTAPVLPVDGTPGDFLLPPLMTEPLLLPMPSDAQGSACQINAIGAAAGPSLVYVTPIVAQGW
jgi:hypothetical protein